MANQKLVILLLGNLSRFVYCRLGSVAPRRSVTCCSTAPQQRCNDTQSPERQSESQDTPTYVTTPRPPEAILVF